MKLWVYAIAAAGEGRVPRVTGVGGEPVRALRAGGLTVFVGTLRRVPAPTALALRRHDAAIRALHQTRTILPARFGTVVTDVDELAFIMRSRSASLKRALRLVRGRAQMTVRIVHPDANEAERPADRRADRGRAAPSSEPDRTPPLRPGAGREYLQGRADRAARERQVPGFDPVRAAVARLVRDERVERHRTVSTVYHLVPRSAAVPYRMRVAAASGAAGVRAVVTGPFPPYAFAGW